MTTTKTKLSTCSTVILCLAVASQLWTPASAGQSMMAQPSRAQPNPTMTDDYGVTQVAASGRSPKYYYTRTRSHPSHLRVAEEVKNQYVNEVKYESKINGTNYEYYASSSLMSYDELVYETIDKIFRHRLSPFYIHHYDHEEDKRRSSDPQLVSQEACARDLLYLVEKLPKGSLFKNPFDSFADDKRAGLEDEHITPELSAFFDSYARQEAGLLRGNTYWVGSHDQCVNRHIFELVDSAPNSDSTGKQQQQRGKQDQKQQVVSFKGRYCVASLKAPSWDKLIQNKKRNARNYFKTERQFREYSKLFRLQLGICLPDSCDSTASERHLDEINLLAKSTLEPRFADYELIDLYCLPDETSPLRQWSSSALSFIALMAVWLTAIMLATLADVLEIFDQDLDEASTKPASRRLRLVVRLLSLRANYRKLMQVNSGGDGDDEESNENGRKGSKPKGANEQSSSEAPVPNKKERKEETQGSSAAAPDSEQRPQIRIDLRFLNAFKALIMFWIINGHIMLLMIQTAKNILDSDALLNGLMHFLIGATFGVDLFFTMTGFLTAYLLFNSGHAFKMKPATWIYLSFHRYWRLAPMYVLTFWFSRSVMQSLGSGPLWDYGTSSITFRGLCNGESWWYPLTLTSNLHGLFEECMITSWYISCDMQFWLVSPVFIYLLAKSPASGWLATIATILASSKVRYDAILSNKSARYDELVQPRADIFMRVSHDLPALYTHPHHRIAAYLIGLLAGHYVYMIKSGKWNSVLTEDLAHKQQMTADELVRDDNKTTDDEASSTTTTLEQRRQSARPDENDEGVSLASSQDDAGDNKLETQQEEETTTTTLLGRTTSSTTKDNDTTLNVMTRAQRSRRTRNALAHAGLALVLVMALSSYLLNNYFPSSCLKYSKLIAAGLHALAHLAMSLGASLVIVTMCLGQWSKLARFLSHPNWTRLSKINYALLLLQCEAIYFQIFRYDQVPLAGTRELINILFNLLVTLYPIAFLATLAFEFPLANLEKVVMSRLLSGKSKAS